jgi:uncharacterized protein (TIGR00251 family)
MKSKDAILDITVVPRSSKSGIIIDNDNIKIYTKSPPVNGKANEEILKILSKELNIAKSKINIIKGEKSRKKRVSLDSITQEDILRIIKNKI